jgi:hypothetical protein
MRTFVSEVILGMESYTNSDSNLRLDRCLSWQLFQENGILLAYRETASGLSAYVFNFGYYELSGL